LAGHLFFERFWDHFCSVGIAIFYESGFQNGAKLWSMGTYFSESVQKQKSVFGLHRRVRIAYEPILRSAQGDPKNEEKRESISEVLF